MTATATDFEIETETPVEVQAEDQEVKPSKPRKPRRELTDAEKEERARFAEANRVLATRPVLVAAPPPSVKRRVAASRYDRFRAALTANPGQWAVMMVAPFKSQAQTRASMIRTGTGRGWDTHNWDAIVTEGPEGGFEVWVTCNGELDMVDSEE